MVTGLSREDRSAPSPLQKIVPIVLLLGSLGTIVSWLTRDADPWVFLQVGAAGALFVYFLTFVDIVLGLAILIGCVGLSPEISFGGVQNLRLEDFVIPALLMAWLLRAGHTRAPLAPSGLGGLVLAYVVVLLASTLVGVAAGTTRLGEAVVLIGKYLEYFTLFVLIVNNVRTEQEFKALAIFSILVAVVSALLFSGATLMSPAPASKVAGPLGETANIYGGYLVLNLAIAVGLFLHAATPGQRIAASAAIALLGIPLLHTYSRTSSVSLAIGLLAFGLTKERRILLVLLILGLLVPLIAPESVWSHLMTVTGVVTGSHPPSWDARIMAWEEAVPRVLGSSPILGFGPGSVRRGDVDSEYVRALVDSGFLGLGLFAALLFRIGKIAFLRHDAIRGPGFHKGYAAGFLIAFLALLVHAVAATSFTAIRTAEGFMILAGLYFCQVNRLAEWTAPPTATAGVPLVLIPPPAADPLR
ncbi:MAG TPA: O-antigen ligase family protein [Planctomycetota bacterium]|nr:O-antigen ligase family protein [Planctomycetota bacterium]